MEERTGGDGLVRVGRSQWICVGGRTRGRDLVGESSVTLFSISVSLVVAISKFPNSGFSKAQTTTDRAVPFFRSRTGKVAIYGSH